MKPICSEWEERLSLYVDGLLNPFDENAVETHLSRCEACREAVALWRAVGQSVRRLPRELPPADLRARILACTTRKLSIGQRLRLSWWRLAPALAAGLLLAWWTLPRFTPEPLSIATQPESPGTLSALPPGSDSSDRSDMSALSDLTSSENEVLRTPQPDAEAHPASSETRILIVVQPATAPRWREPSPRWVATTRIPTPQANASAGELRTPTPSHEVALMMPPPSTRLPVPDEVADLPVQTELAVAELAPSSGERAATHASLSAPSEPDALRRWAEQFNQQLQQENRRSRLKQLARRSNDPRFFVPILSWNIK
jgi:AcrR family transcriptional regulator